MDGKIRVLFYNRDSSGVNYFRSLTPSIQLDRDHSEEFYVEINPNINMDDPNIIDYLTAESSDQLNAIKDYQRLYGI